MKSIGVALCFFLFNAACSATSEQVTPNTTIAPTSTVAATAAATPTTRAGIEDSGLLEPPGFPRICQAWNGIQNRPDLSDLEKIAKHDLWFSTPWSLGLLWQTSIEQPYPGLSTSLTDINGDTSLSAARELKSSLLELNPHIKTIATVLYREGEFEPNEEGLALHEYGHYAAISPYWIKDSDGSPVPGFGEDLDKDGEIEEQEILSSLIDFRRQEVIELVSQKALALAESGIVDGIFLDWWNEHNVTAASYLDWSYSYMTLEEEVEARLAILHRIRQLVGDDFLVLVNTNDRTAPLSSPYVNGIFMEAGKDIYSEGYTSHQLKMIEESLYWGSENLREPRINCLEGWRVVYDYGNTAAQVVERDSAENRRWMRVFTTLALTHSDGHVVFGDDNSEPTWDHYHNWYNFWDADLGQPVSAKRQILDGTEGLFIREFTNGYALYNRSGTSQIISLGVELQAVSTGHWSFTHELEELDGDIYLIR
ncbi:MAG: hypothetical protein CL897_01810 [Dehalococcoidia bacterium]|nr:hypothetical protein [Dehalococcoidia bacterium]|tara:strand:- start:1006 stop:2448 length:1443 start_codon:yes stop_codon:yes gene_type:complete